MTMRVTKADLEQQNAALLSQNEHLVRQIEQLSKRDLSDLAADVQARITGEEGDTLFIEFADGLVNQFMDLVVVDICCDDVQRPIEAALDDFRESLVERLSAY